MNWEHMGVKITVNERGTFIATRQGEKITATSLNAIKEKIDERNLTKFEPFDIVRVINRGYGDMKPELAFGHVTGVMKDRARIEFRIEEKGKKGSGAFHYGSSSSVYPDTPENRKELLEIATARNGLDRDYEKAKAELSKREKAIPQIHAINYSVKK